jgi:hypothetical protein
MHSYLVSVVGSSLRRDKSCWEYFFDTKTILYFLIKHFCWEIVKCYQFFRVIYCKFISDPELLGSGMIFPDMDPAK